MTTVFLSGSRRLGRLNGQIRQRIQNITERSFEIVLGDADGADKALQDYLHSLDYPNVTIYCAGGHCRNNLGAWSTVSVDAAPNLRGRAFYTQKDRVMAEKADYGFALWDGKSAGTISNVVELLKGGKKALTYFSPKRVFHSITAVLDLRLMLEDCEKRELERIDEKIRLMRSLQELERSTQIEIGFHGPMEGDGATRGAAFPMRQISPPHSHAG